MRRFLAALSIAALVAAIVPGVAQASRPFKADIDHIGIGCFSTDEDVIGETFIDRDFEFGDSAFVAAWLDGANPDEDLPSLEGFTDTIEVVEGDPITFSATIPVSDADGNPLGDVQVDVTAEPDGEPFIDTGFDVGNITSHTMIVVQPLIGAGTMTLPDETEVELDCGGDITHGQEFVTNPNAFVLGDEGVAFGCDWEIDGGFAFVFGSNSTFGTSIDGGFIDEDSDVFTPISAEESLDSTGVSATLDMIDFLSEDTYTGQVEATFSPNGDPVSFTILEQRSREKVTEQDLSVDGTFTITPGETLVMDDEHCDGSEFKSHRVATSPRGPRGGKAPVNDTPDGAIDVEVGTRLNAKTAGTDPFAEVPNLSCDEAEIDLMGHTLWYTGVGTGDEITIDTTGSNFDTVVAVYVEEGGELVEIACVDDVFSEPAGLSLQASLTGLTEAGVTYWIQVGGWGGIFDDAQFGRLRLKIS